MHNLCSYIRPYKSRIHESHMRVGMRADMVSAQTQVGRGQIPFQPQNPSLHALRDAGTEIWFARVELQSIPGSNCMQAIPVQQQRRKLQAEGAQPAAAHLVTYMPRPSLQVCQASSAPVSFTPASLRQCTVTLSSSPKLHGFWAEAVCTEAMRSEATRSQQTAQEATLKCAGFDCWVQADLIKRFDGVMNHVKNETGVNRYGELLPQWDEDNLTVLSTCQDCVLGRI